jgi:epoxyqueuosine reductase
MALKDSSVSIRETMKLAGYEAVTVDIAHLAEAQAAVSRLVGQGLVNDRLSESWKFYLDTNEGLPEARTIFVIAVPQPLVRAVFRWQGKDHHAEIAPGYFYRADEARAGESLKSALESGGYKMVKAHLPLKTLAVRSGLAEYGRNNIAYVPGMGSFLRLVAYYSDCPCEEDRWGGYRVMPACADCSLCRQSCPTGSIDAERFLIRAESCLGFLGERQPDFPYWVRLQPDWRNGLVGCMLCQFVCPVNSPYVDNIKEGPSFSEEETRMVLDFVPLDRLPTETRNKLSDIAKPIYPLLARNLHELIARRTDSV